MRIAVILFLALLLLPALASASEPRRMTSTAEMGARGIYFGVNGLGGIDPGLQSLEDSARGMTLTFGYGRTQRVKMGVEMGLSQGTERQSTANAETFRINGFALRGTLQQNLFSAGGFLLDYAVDSGISTAWSSPMDRYAAVADFGPDSAFNVNNTLGLVTGFVFQRIHTAVLLKAGAHQQITLNTWDFELFPTARLHLEWRVPLGDNFSLNPHLGAATFIYSPEAGVNRTNGAIVGGVSILRVP